MNLIQIEHNELYNLDVELKDMANDWGEISGKKNRLSKLISKVEHNKNKSDIRINDGERI